MSQQDDAELQARLIEESSREDIEETHREEMAGGMAEDSVTPTQPLVAPDADSAEEELQPGSRIGEYEIVEIVETKEDQTTYRAQAPADLCAQCGTRALDPDARFCEECGAELLPRDVLLIEIRSDDREHITGPARLVDLPDEPARQLLPPVSSFEAKGRLYLVLEAAVPGFQALAELLASQGETPQQPAALDETDALPVALSLAQLLQFLHTHDTALGDLSLAQLLIGSQRRLRLRDANSLQPLDERTRRQDLRQLVSTIEDLTRTPRQTRKLSTGKLEDQNAQPASLEEVLALGRIGSLPTAEAWVQALESVTTSKNAIRGLHTRVGSHTDVGIQREINEDSLMTQELRIAIESVYVNAGIYVVADGMGGHAAGEVASGLAVQAAATSLAQQLVELASRSGGLDEQRLGELVTAAGNQANLAVFQEAQRRRNDMGATLTLALVVGDRCIVGNVGDSRTYLFRDGQLQRISKDHSLVMRLVDLGQITEDEIYSHPHRSAIMRSLGEKRTVEVDLFPLRLRPGDALFLCSDGQWEMVRNPRMEEIIATIDDPQEACNVLVEEANANGGEDNIAAVLVRFS
jgi:PPM family protein phosphatase